MKYRSNNSATIDWNILLSHYLCDISDNGNLTNPRCIFSNLTLILPWIKADLLKKFQQKIIHERLNPIHVTIDMVQQETGFGHRHSGYSSRGRHSSSDKDPAGQNAGRRHSNTQKEMLEEFNKVVETGDETPKSGDATPIEDEPDDHSDVTPGGIVIIPVPKPAVTTTWESAVPPETDVKLTPTRNDYRGEQDHSWGSPERNGYGRYGTDRNHDGRSENPAYDESQDSRWNNRWSNSDKYYNRRDEPRRYRETRRDTGYGERNGRYGTRKDMDRMNRPGGPTIIDSRPPKGKYNDQPSNKIYTQAQVFTIHHDVSWRCERSIIKHKIWLYRISPMAIIKNLILWKSPALKRKLDACHFPFTFCAFCKIWVIAT